MRLNILINSEYEPLYWKSPFSQTQPFYPNMVRIRTIPDGSCFFHSIVKAFYEPYQLGRLDNKVLSRTDFVKNLRTTLALTLAAPISLDTNLTHYDVLSRGKLAEMSKDNPRYTLENMQKELKNTIPVDNLFNEYVSNILEKDVYLLDAIKQDVYVTGNDFDILYKNRKSIVILVIPGHYELVGIQKQSGIQTLFDPDDDFILTIKRRLRQLTNLQNSA